MAETSEDKVLAIIRDKLELRHVKSEDIETAHRVGKRNQKGARAVIVRFVSRKVKTEVFRNRKKILEKKCGVFIVENLTKKKLSVVGESERNPHVDKVWTANCKVFVKTKNSQIVQIGSLQDLHALPLPGDVIAGGDATSKTARTRGKVTQPHRRGQGRRGRGSVRGGSRRPYRRRGPGSSNRPPLPPPPPHPPW